MKTYRGKPGCGCGCLGTYSEVKGVVTRRINEMKALLADGERVILQDCKDTYCVAYEDRSTFYLWLFFPTREAALETFGEAVLAAQGDVPLMIFHGLVGSDGTFIADLHPVESSDVAEIVAHMKGNCTTAGLSVNYVANPTTKQVLRVWKKGKLAQKDIRDLVAGGFTIWGYSWAWGPKVFVLNGERIETARDRQVGLCLTRTAWEYRRVL